MKNSSSLVVFLLEHRRYALILSTVQRIVHVVDIVPLPKAPEIVLGVINVNGRVIPVLDIRKRFRLPEREINLTDHLIIATSLQKTVALLVDTVIGVIQHSAAEQIPADRVLSGMEYVRGVVKLEDGLVLIHDLDTFLSLGEQKVMDNALKKA